LTFALNQIIFEAKDYDYLKSFFTELIKIQNERIILTKTN
jgi:ribosomal protein S18